MRGSDERSEGLFSYVSCEARVPGNHPLRPVRAIVDEALAVMSPAFEGLYSKIGRPSIPPEKLLRALLLSEMRARDVSVSLPNSSAVKLGRGTSGAFVNSMSFPGPVVQ